MLGLLSPVVNNISNFRLSRENDPEYSWTFLVVILIILVIMALLIFFGWWKTDKIVKLLVRDIGDSSLTISTTNLDLIKVMMGIFGVWLVIQAIPLLLGSLSYHTYYASYLIPGIEQDPAIVSSEIREVVTQSITLVIGIFLLLGNSIVAKGLVKLWSTGNTKGNSDITPK